ncbi:MAG: TIGR00282 family metallophosphoesterase [Candidatus Margulisbacteria bacterium]|nr:TIGR00282 family metallophosphoesterase [Candidatus Margulisiibacteriota bacterium]
MNILCIGDIIGRSGRRVLAQHLEEIIAKHNIHFTIVNVENSAGGNGLTRAVYEELAGLNIDAFTSGNHIYDKRDIFKQFEELNLLLRPLNFPKGQPGTGIRYFERNGLSIAVVNIIGRVFMGLSDCPFQKMQQVLPIIKEKADIILVDFHAETTSEKQAMGWMLDGNVSLLFGTHTHVPTADDRVLPSGTAYISDIGMTGPRDSVIGVDRHIVIKKFLDQLPVRFELPRVSSAVLNGICVKVDTESGKALSISRIYEVYDE